MKLKIMMMTTYFLTALACGSITFFSISSRALVEKAQDVVICKGPKAASAGGGSAVGKSVRTLRVYETKEVLANGDVADGCRATYSKTSTEQIVGSSRQRSQCQSILSGIQKNLEASNWSCRKAGTMSVLKSSAAASSEAQGDNQTESKTSVVQ